MVRTPSFFCAENEVTVVLKERVHAGDEELRRERLLRGILTNSADGIVLIDENALIQEWSPGQERITGITRAEAAGEPLFDVLFRLMPADRRTIDAYVQTKEHIAEYLRSGADGDSSRATESEIVRPDGRRRSLETRYFSIRRNGDSKLASITRDVTERRMLERAELDIIRTREQFVASVSEGLRSPLQKLLGTLASAAADESPSSDRLLAALERAHASAQELSDLVSGLSEAAKFERGVELSMDDVDLQRIIRQALASAQQQADKKRIPVAYAPGDGPPTVRANGPRLLQAIQSLLHNAIRMSEAGSPVIVSTVVHDGQVTVQVTDQGPGIPSAAEPAVFAKHPLGLLPGEDQNESGGLELYLSRKIIEAHGGQIGVRSQLGVGSTFYFSLPLAAHPRI